MLKTLLLSLCLGVAVPAQTFVTLSGTVKGCASGSVLAGMNYNGAVGIYVAAINQDGSFMFTVPSDATVTVNVAMCSVSPKSYTVELNGQSVDGLLFKAPTTLRKFRREAFGLRF